MTRNQHRRQAEFARKLTKKDAGQPENQRLHLNVPGTASLAAWFLGPKAENREVLRTFLNRTLDATCDERLAYYREDPVYVTEARKDEAYRESLKEMETQHEKLLNALKGSVPFYSYRYQAHMNWELTLPGILGYFSAMLYNQNNVAAEASPVTTRLESQVGQDLCRMLGYEVPVQTFGQTPVPTSGQTSGQGGIVPWGHITCDGSVANLEAMWASRNLNYYAISVSEALKHDDRLSAARNITVKTPGGQQARLVDLDIWEMQNLDVDVVLALPQRIQELGRIEMNVVSEAIDPYLLQSLGFDGFSRRYLQNESAPVILGPATKHYSWPKNAAVLGIGKDQFLNVAVDEDARMSVGALKNRLEECLNTRTPVLMVVAVLGSTEESAVDPLQEVLELREQYRTRGLNFAIHVDSAWGGYFASMLRTPANGTLRSQSPQETPVLPLSDYVTRQYQALSQADSITVDPHKAGYIPYPAGGLCYRNGAMRNLVAFLAPEVYHQDEVDACMGVYGIEGSKPGAAAAAVYLSHSVIRPDQSGYGRILGQALFNSKRFYSAVITMAGEKDPFVVVPVQRIPAERQGGSQEEIRAQLNFIRDRIVRPENNQLIKDEEAMALLGELGSDQIIITYGFNYREADGTLNTDPVKVNAFNHRIFERLSLSPDTEEPGKTPLIITTSTFDPADYGQSFVDTYMQRLGVTEQAGLTMNFLSSTTMSPWLTATAQGNFIPRLTEAFRRVVLEVVQEFRQPRG